MTMWQPSTGVWCPHSRGVERYDAMPTPIAGRRRSGYSGGTNPPPPNEIWDPGLQAYQDTGHTTAAIANNDPIAYLTSQTGTTHDMTNSGGSQRPLLQTNSLNGHSTMIFNGSSNLLQAAWTIADAPITIIMAMNMVTWVSNAFIANDQFNLIELLQNPSSPGVAAYNASQHVNNSGFVLGQWAILGFRINAGASGVMSLWNNLNAVEGAGNFFGPAAGFSFGATYGGGGYSNVGLGRIYMWNSFLNNTNFQGWIQSFGAYYGLF